MSNFTTGKDRILFANCLLPLHANWHRKVKSTAHALSFGFGPDLTIPSLNNSVSNIKPQPRTFKPGLVSTGRKLAKFLKEQVYLIRINADTGIGNTYQNTN